MVGMTDNVRGIKEDRPRYEAEQVGHEQMIIRSTTVDLQRRFYFNPFVICCRFHKWLFGAKKKENKNFLGGVRWQYLSLEVGIKVMTPNGKGIFESIIEDIHPSANVRMEDGTLKNFMHPTTEIINGNLEFVWNLKHTE
jgi:hypothetical protein